MTFEELSQSVTALQQRLTGQPPAPPTGPGDANLAPPKEAPLPSTGREQDDRAQDERLQSALDTLGAPGNGRRHPDAPAVNPGHGPYDHDKDIDALARLSLALEELQVATEALRQQNEELALAATRIEAERRRYRDLFESAPDAYLVTDQMGIIRELNRAGGRLLNLPADFLLGKPLIVFVPVSDRQRFRQFIGQAWSEGAAERCDFTLEPRHRPALRVAVTVATCHDAGEDRTLLHWLVREAGAGQPAAAPQAGAGSGSGSSPSQWPTEGLAIESLLAGPAPKEAELTRLLEETVLVLRKTKGAFRSKELGALRVRLESALGRLDEL